MAGNSASLYFYCFYLLSFRDYLPACPLRPTIHVLYFTFCGYFANTPRNIKHSLYNFRILCEFHVSLMPGKNKPRNPSTFHANVDPGTKCEKQKKGTGNGKKVTRNTPLFTFSFSHFTIVLAYFTLSV